MTKHIIERACKKGAFKKIAEKVEEENAKTERYLNLIRQRATALKLR